MKSRPNPREFRDKIERALDAAAHYQPRVSRFASKPERQRTLNRSIEAAALLFRAARTIANPDALAVNVAVSERIIEAVYVAVFGMTLRKAAAMALIGSIEDAAEEARRGEYPVALASTRARNKHLAEEGAVPPPEIFLEAVEAWLASERATLPRPRRGRVPAKWRVVAKALDSVGLRPSRSSVATIARDWKAWKKKRTVADVLKRHMRGTSTP